MHHFLVGVFSRQISLCRNFHSKVGVGVISDVGVISVEYGSYQLTIFLMVESRRWLRRFFASWSVQNRRRTAHRTRSSWREDTRWLTRRLNWSLSWLRQLTDNRCSREAAEPSVPDWEGKIKRLHAQILILTIQGSTSTAMVCICLYSHSAWIVDSCYFDI